MRGKSRLAREFTALVTGRDGRMAPHSVVAGWCWPASASPTSRCHWPRCGGAIDDHLDAVRALPAGRPGPRSSMRPIRAAAVRAPLAATGLSPDLDDLLGAPDAGRRATGDQQFAGRRRPDSWPLWPDPGGGRAAAGLDDVQWLDDATSRVLRQLDRAARPAAVDPGHPGPRTRSHVAWLRRVGPGLDLTRLAPAARRGESADLIAVGHRRAAVDERRGRAGRPSGGNPFTILQYVDAVHRSPACSARTGAAGWSTPTACARSPLPTDAVDLDPEPARRSRPGQPVRCSGSAPSSGPLRSRAGRARCATRDPPHRRGGRPPPRGTTSSSARVGRLRLRPRPYPRGAARPVRPGRAPGPARSGRRRARRQNAGPAAAAPRYADGVYALARHCLRGDPTGRPDRVFRACRRRRPAAPSPIRLPTRPSASWPGHGRRRGGPASTPTPTLMQLLGLAQHRAGRFGDAIASLAAPSPQPPTRSNGPASWPSSPWSTTPRGTRRRRPRPSSEALAELGVPAPKATAGRPVHGWDLFAAQLRDRPTRGGDGARSPPTAWDLRLRASLYCAGPVGVHPRAAAGRGRCVSPAQTCTW